jgi:Stress responsive A/B Barrel Domain
VLRHTALFMFRDTTTDEGKLVAKKGLAYLAYGCPSVRSVDFGTDLRGGSGLLTRVKPWDRTPLWDARTVGPPSDFDMALHLDFDDQAGLDHYNKDDVHHEVAVYNVSVCEPERTARIDWWYDGPPRFERGGVRRTSLFLWSDEATDPQKDDVRAAFAALNRSVPGLGSLLTGDNVGTLRTDYDLLVDAQFGSLSEVEAYLEHPGFREALALAASTTKFEWTANITHTMSSG